MFHCAKGLNLGVAPEFLVGDEGDVCRLRLKNLHDLLDVEVADAGFARAQGQAGTFPVALRDRMTVLWVQALIVLRPLCSAAAEPSPAV